VLGIFDSGVGGLTALREIRRIAPSVDLCFLADGANAPYGTKTRGELIRLVCDDVDFLRKEGCERILMACCTASAAHKHLPEDIRRIAFPIIPAAAKETALATRSGRVGVIATESTVKSKEFLRELYKYPQIKSVFQLPVQELVALVEGGTVDTRVSIARRERIAELLLPMRRAEVDTLIMGCTHFPHLEATISGILPGVRLINPSLAGAREFTKGICIYEKGVTKYFDTSSRGGKNG
jgi:glutamate racemase